MTKVSRAAIAAGRKWGNSSATLDELLSGINYVARGNPESEYSIEEWLGEPEISDRQMELFPSAKAAAEIKKSPLYRLL